MRRTVIWGFQEEARLIYDALEEKPAYFVDDSKEKDNKVYRGCPVRTIEYFLQDKDRKYIYISQIAHYETLRLQFVKWGLTEGIDFSGGFEYLPQQVRADDKLHIENSWDEKRELYQIWNHRVVQMSRYISASDRTVLDLGCGNGYLKELLDETKIRYLGCDCIKRENAFYQCDFNRYEFPEVKADVAFISGCLEYIRDCEWLIRKAGECSDKLILSYQPLEYISNINRRCKLGYCSHYSILQILGMAERNGLYLAGIEHSYTRDIIAVFNKTRKSPLLSKA